MDGFNFYKKVTRIAVIALVFMACSSSMHAQEVEKEDPRLIQLSGIIVTGDSLLPVPYCSVIIKNTNRGTTADYFGYFSLVAAEGDEIEFTSVGFKTSTFILPDSLEDNRYSYIQILSPLITQLGQVDVYPWPSKEAFKEAFVSAEKPEDALNATENLGPSQLLVMLETSDPGGFSNYKTNSLAHHNELYYAGQAPQINLLNPLAWVDFIDAWRSGKYKLKKD